MKHIKYLWEPYVCPKQFNIEMIHHHYASVMPMSRAVNSGIGGGSLRAGQYTLMTEIQLAINQRQSLADTSNAT